MKKYTLLAGLFLFQFAVLFPVFAQNSDTGVDTDYHARSLSLTQQAKNAYEEGDYDASILYAEEAARYAQLSTQPPAGRPTDTRAPANAATGDTRAGTVQGTGQSVAQATNTQGTQTASRPGRGPTAARADGTFPAQYVVQSWKTTGDSLSAIAARPYVYGDGQQWRILYEANKDKLPNPNNPHLILPGMVLDIPSIGGEVRQGVYTP
ncbi:hypothetical protein FACS1894161_3100 [Spirochaetia bacterium]|nr:hypothetical protein FACS1894161_3100 [Spirochaetia bacterium]